jgi:asparagine synthase (glutamine-hydrolysing)
VSAVAGIVHFDGAPVEAGLVERMTGAMRGRGPDGLRHWRKESAAFGACMLRTTPESLEERQPLPNEDESVVLAMDGRVDNREELQRALSARGAPLRDRSDAELILRAYETWGEESPQHVVGECVFFIWDFRRRQLFAARDAAGTRHFYYHAGNGWFAFASEIAGLLALERIEPRLNESRLLDFLVEEFDRDDEIGTFYQGISRLPAGHAMRVTGRGAETWRYWNPGALSALRFRSLDECAEAFREQLRIAVKCRLRSNGPVGAMLSGGLDSSSIAGLIAKEFRDALPHPLRTFSLIPEDRRNSEDWKGVQEMLKEAWFDPTIITPVAVHEVYRHYIDSVPDLNEPFALADRIVDSLVYEAAREKGCRVMLEGMAGDLLFYGSHRSAAIILRGGMVAQIPATLAAWRRHGLQGELATVVSMALRKLAPQGLRAHYRRLRDRYGRLDEDVKLLHRPLARSLLARRRLERRRDLGRASPATDQSGHARNFTTGLLPFAHEVNGQLALSIGVEPRSPFSDRRIIEFAIRMPLEAKLCAPWYKFLLRKSMAGILPENVRWRRRSEGHPSDVFHDAFIEKLARGGEGIWNPNNVNDVLARWVDPSSLRRAQRKYDRDHDSEVGYNLLRCAVLARWLAARGLADGAEDHRRNQSRGVGP